MSFIKNTWKIINSKLVNICWTYIQRSTEPVDISGSNFPDLCPTDDAKNVEVYINRLNDLLANRSDTVRGIAITAPYSGGKSSLINTYIKKNPQHIYTCISLSSFDGAKTDDELLNKIERSITQQILYRTDSTVTPNSRFRRIYLAPPSYWKSILTSAVVVLWLLIAMILWGLDERDFFRGISDFTISFYWSNPFLYIGSFFISIPVLILKDIYMEVQNFTISKMNPIKWDVELDRSSHESTFNKYLEEIIYYFSKTKCDVVFFEDLDRFNEINVLIHLRELNKLINDSADVTQSVRFVYALKDDVFKGNDRTKFFDSIIPVIPVASTTNAYPQLSELLESSGLKNDLTDDFLRDLAIYLDDLRMIKNIVSEYGIYCSALVIGLPRIDKQKLFSFIVFKNFYSKDFAMLHEGEGALFHVFKRSNDIKLKVIEDIKVETGRLERTLIASDMELTDSLQALNAESILKIAKSIYPAPAELINGIQLGELMQPKHFDAAMKNINPMQSSASNRGRQNHQMSFPSMVNTTSPSYENKKESILNKSFERQALMKNNLSQLRNKLVEITNLTAEMMIEKYPNENFFTNIENERLLSHMIKKGYLDEQYHLYTTYFIEGNMSSQDMDFVMSVKNKTPTSATIQLNNFKEVRSYLSDYEFRSEAFLNYGLFSYLLRSKDFVPLRTFIRHTVANLNNRMTILLDSITSISPKRLWIPILNSDWEDIYADVLNEKTFSDDDKCLILSSLFSFSDDDMKLEVTENIANSFKILFDSYKGVHRHFPNNSRDRDKFFTTLSLMEVKIKQLPFDKDNSEFNQYALKHRTIEVNLNNLMSILKAIGAPFSAEGLDYTTLAEVNDDEFTTFLNGNLSPIVDLMIDGFITVNNEAMVSLLDNTLISVTEKNNMIDSVDFVIDKVWETNENENYLQKLIDCGKLKATWDNVAKLIKAEYVDDATIAIFLSDPKVVKELTDRDFKLDSETISVIASSIASIALNPEVFGLYYEHLNFQYPVKNLALADRDILLFLINNYHIEAVINTFYILESIDEHASLLFLSLNIDSFISNGKLDDKLDLNVSVFYNLLSMKNISLESKRIIIKSKRDLISRDMESLPLVESLILMPNEHYRVDPCITSISVDVLQFLLEDTSNADLKNLLLAGQVQHLDKAQIVSMIPFTGDDFPSILTSKSHIKVSKNNANKCLADALVSVKFVSSVSSTSGGFFEDNKIKINLKKWQFYRTDPQ